MKPVVAWAVVDENGKLVTGRFNWSWGTIYVIGKTISDTPLLETGERVLRVEIREVTRPKKAKRKRKEWACTASL